MNVSDSENHSESHEAQSHSANPGHARTDPFFDCLARLGFAPQHIVDVGANRGNWTRTALRYFPQSYYTLLEPQEKMRQEVADLTLDPKVTFYAMGAGPVNASMKLTEHERDDSFTFALDENQALALGRKQIEVPVIALDDFLPRTGLPHADILKIDAEGWDLEVLKGADNTIRNASIVLIEAAVNNKIFKNSVFDVLMQMNKRNFTLFDITDLNRTIRHNALWLVELAFVKKDGFLNNSITSFA
jgi:FkbM family methyltransferase